MNFIKIITLFLLTMIKNINTKQIFIKKKSIISFFYYNYENKSISISINNNKYRESSLLPYNKGIFSININKGIYNISTYPYNINYKYIVENGIILNKNKIIHDILFYKNKYKLVDEINYQYKTNHILKISSMINFISFNKNITYYVKIFIDNIYFENIYNKKTFSYISDKIYLKKGYHSIKLLVKSINDTLCSCITANKGFTYGRFLNAWLINNKKKYKYKSKNKIYKKNNNIYLNNICQNNDIYTYLKSFEI
jgi:hypothetical protein